MRMTPITWPSIKQKMVALFTTETEYITATAATRDTKWLANLLREAQLPLSASTPHYIDSFSAIVIVENQAPTKQRKYIQIHQNYLQHHVANETIILHRIPKATMKAEIFTKPLQRGRFQQPRTALNVTPRPTSKCVAPTKDCETTPGTLAAPHFFDVKQY
eukprot:gb/GEZJ01001297.1/.p1 GENE.gb/GEZJ01001297.1/~~gb/GEZJ01001297.1/.p1  ORF type:complete len:161 (+),score=9.29 gb/GEZJ01001297.1/:823-1305(+)